VQNTARTLVIVRHATAEPYAASEQERELTSQGAADARAAGEWLASSGVRPDHALVSAATRALATWTALAGAAGWDLEPELDASLYAAGPESALDLVRMTDAGVGTLVLVGHNPTMASLAHLLDDGEGDPEAAAGMATGFPPCAIAILRIATSWADLDDASARVVGFHVGRA
jgi:phosphohistidine phosphatase